MTAAPSTPAWKPGWEHRMLSMPSRHLKPKRSSRGNRTRAPPPQMQTCTCKVCSETNSNEFSLQSSAPKRIPTCKGMNVVPCANGMPHKAATQNAGTASPHAIASRCPPRRDLEELRGEMHPPANSQNASSQQTHHTTQSLQEARIGAPLKNCVMRYARRQIQNMQKHLYSAVRAWHASRALGRGAYPRHAGQSLHAHGVEKNARRRPPRQHEVGTGGTRQTPHAEPPPRANSGPSGSSARAPPHFPIRGTLRVARLRYLQG